MYDESNIMKWGEFMAREKSNIEFSNVSMRIPAELYKQYKAVLAKTGSIVTYDVRNYMKSVVDKDKNKNQEGRK